MSESPSPARIEQRHAGGSIPSKHDRGFLKLVARTGSFNMTSSLIAAVTGIVIARTLGPEGRGDYAAVMTAFGLTQVFCEVGLSVSLVYFVSRQPKAMRHIMRNAGQMLAGLASVGVGVLFLLTRTEILGQRERPVAALIMATAVVFSFLSGPVIFSLQATNLMRWNQVRLLQPVLGFVLTILLALIGRLNLLTAVSAVAVSILLQAVIAWMLHARTGVGRDERETGPSRRTLLGFGALNVLAAAPASLNIGIDQLYLAAAVPSAELGVYAVAVSLSVLVSPAVAAFGNVAFPRIASSQDRRQTTVTSLLGTAVVSSLAAGAIVVGSTFLIEPVFGTGYTAALPLLYVLAPGSVFLMVSRVGSDVLRGFGRAKAVAAAQWLGLLFTGVGLVVTVPRWGAMGAAVTSTLAYLVVSTAVLALLRDVLRRRQTLQLEEVVS